MKVHLLANARIDVEKKQKLKKKKKKAKKKDEKATDTPVSKKASASPEGQKTGDSKKSLKLPTMTTPVMAPLSP